jgi:hypothetical protein
MTDLTPTYSVEIVVRRKAEGRRHNLRELRMPVASIPVDSWAEGVDLAEKLGRSA